MTQTRILWDSRALTSADWNRDKRSLSADGWQVNPVQGGPGVVYIRKPYLEWLNEPSLTLDEAPNVAFVHPDRMAAFAKWPPSKNR